MDKEQTGVEWISGVIQSLGEMPFGWLSFVLLSGMGIAAFTTARIRAFELSAAAKRPLRAHPNTHAVFALLACLLPIVAALLVLSFVDGPIERRALVAELPARLSELPMVDLDRYLDGLDRASVSGPGQQVDVFDRAATDRLLELRGEVRAFGYLFALLAGAAGIFFALRIQTVDAPVRRYVERGVEIILQASAGLAVLVTLGILASLLVESFRFFSTVSPISFLFGLEWNAQSGRSFGAVPLFFGTLVVAVVAMCLAIPVGLFSAIYLSEYARPSTRRLIKPALEVLAGIPTVVYGFFAIVFMAPLVQWGATAINALPFIPDNFLAAQPSSALAAGLVLGIMTIPYISSLVDDVLTAVPQEYRQAGYALGSTQSELIRNILFPVALPGISAAILLAVSRAVGETMIVVMAAGQRPHITADVTSDMTTVTAQIVSLLTADTAFDSATTLSAFALGAALFATTLFFNQAALSVVRRMDLRHV